MKACVLENVGNLIYKNVPTPSPAENEVLIKIKACGICSSDVPRVFITGTYHFPTIPGHEFSGEIIDAGSNVDKNVIGKRVVVFPLVPCRKCDSCRAGEYARCENYKYFGSRCDGGFAEYISVPLWNTVVFSDEIPFTTAALCEPASVAKHCADAGNIGPGDTVAVIGTGTIGLIASVWAKKYGAGKVVLIGRNGDKLGFAKNNFAVETVNISDSASYGRFMKFTEGKGADAVLECVGSAASINNAIVFAKKGGRVVLTGNPEGNIELKKDIYWKILRNELTVKGTWNSSYNDARNDWRSVTEGMSDGSLNLDKLITHTFPLSEHEKAFETIRSHDVFSIKVMFTM